MAIVNRDLDSSEQKEIVNVAYRAVNTGQTMPAFVVPFPCELQAVRAACGGVSGSPIVSFFKGAFVTGAGLTMTAMGVSGIALTATGTSGIQGISILPASGSTAIQLAAGDVIYINSTGANSAVDALSVHMVLKKLQDIVQTDGIS